MKNEEFDKILKDWEISEDSHGNHILFIAGKNSCQGEINELKKENERLLKAYERLKALQLEYEH